MNIILATRPVIITHYGTSFQAFLLYQEPVPGPVQGPFPIIVSLNLLIVLFNYWCLYIRVIKSPTKNE